MLIKEYTVAICIYADNLIIFDELVHQFIARWKRYLI